MTTFPASFPTTSVLPVTCEMFAANDWHDITSDVLTRESGNITITRGLPNEATSITASQCQFEVNNRLHNGESGLRYSPNDPMGPFYGSIGRNTPVRISIGAEVDTFARTVSNGWGTNDSGDSYSYVFAGSGDGTNSFAVSGGVGTQTVSSTAAYVIAHTTQTWSDVDVAVTVSVLPGVGVTGGQIEPANIVLRGQSSTLYYMVRCTIQTGGAVTLQLMDYNNTAIASAVTATVTHSAATLRVRAQVEGGTLRAKVWDPSTTEPSGWLVVGNYMDGVISSGMQQIDTAGWVGVRSGISAGNTNANPIVFSYSNLVIRVPRYAGYLSSLVPTSDVSGIDKYMHATVAGPLRQLNQGQLPGQSTLRHDIPSLANLVAYWPCEDGSAATQFASAFPGGTPMALGINTTGTPPTLASDSTFVGSAPLPVVNASSWLGYVGSYLVPVPAAVQVRCLVHLPAAGTLADGTSIIRFWTYGQGSGTTRWLIYYGNVGSSGNLGVTTIDPLGNVVNDTGEIAFGLDGKAFRLGLSITQSGSNLNCQLSAYTQNAPAAGYTNFTINNYAVTSVQAVQVGSSDLGLTQTAVGHVTVEDAATDIFALSQQFNGFVGEHASDRLKRLCGYIGTEFNYVGDSTAKSVQMGPQPVDTILNLITSCATTDGGLLYEGKGSPALVYRTSGGHLNPGGAQVALDAGQNQLSAWPQVTYDDLQLHNDIIAQRTGGSSYETSLTTGALSTQAPPNGVGIYSNSLTVNTQTDLMLVDVAGWALHLGTVPDARYPQVSINMASTHLTANAALWWAILGLNPDDFATIANLAADTVTLLVRGYTEVLTQLSYTFVWNCAPGSPYTAAILDQSFRLDSDGTTLHAVINTTANSFQVDISDGTLWTTVSSDWPFDVVVDGERMTVGSVSGTSSPQTFSSVTRSVNGVVKTHSAGAKVSLFTPCYLGMGGN
jgi:hypothetical protein